MSKFPTEKMRKRDKSAKEKADKVDSGIEEETSKTTDDHPCSGNLELDFTQQCKLMGVKKIPSVKLKQSKSVMEHNQSQKSLESQMTTWSSEPCLEVELENEDQSKTVKISGWKVDDIMLQVLSRTLPSLSNFQCLHMWRVGLTDCTFVSLRNMVSLCSNLRKVVLDGNPLPEQSYHLLIGEDSMLTDLSLRNSHIGDEGARLIGSSLSTVSTVSTANKKLLSLNLAFNSIGDAGANHIAQGLRLNRSLLCLSLSHNQIGDEGAARLAEVLGPFALTHEEIVERRKLLIKAEQSVIQPSLVSLADSQEQPLSVRSSSSLDRLNKTAKSTTKKKDNPIKEEKPAPAQVAKKEETKVAKKDDKVPRSQAGKIGAKDKNLPVPEQESVEMVKTVIPLLDPGIVHTGGKVIHPGNTCLTSLNLSGNKLTEQSLKLFLSSLESQGEGGLLRLSLNRNRFPSDCDIFLKIQEIMALKDPLNKNNTSQVEDEHGELKTTSVA